MHMRTPMHTRGGVSRAQALARTRTHTHAPARTCTRRRALQCARSAVLRPPRFQIEQRACAAARHSPEKAGLEPAYGPQATGGRGRPAWASAVGTGMWPWPRARCAQHARSTARSTAASCTPACCMYRMHAQTHAHWRMHTRARAHAHTREHTASSIAMRMRTTHRDAVVSMRLAWPTIPAHLHELQHAGCQQHSP